MSSTQELILGLLQLAAAIAAFVVTPQIFQHFRDKRRTIKINCEPSESSTGGDSRIWNILVVAGKTIVSGSRIYIYMGHHDARIFASRYILLPTGSADISLETNALGHCVLTPNFFPKGAAFEIRVFSSTLSFPTAYSDEDEYHINLRRIRYVGEDVSLAALELTRTRLEVLIIQFGLLAFACLMRIGVLGFRN